MTQLFRISLPLLIAGPIQVRNPSSSSGESITNLTFADGEWRLAKKAVYRNWPD